MRNFIRAPLATRRVGVAGLVERMGVRVGEGVGVGCGGYGLGWERTNIGGGFGYEGESGVGAAVGKKNKDWIREMELEREGGK